MKGEKEKEKEKSIKIQRVTRDLRCMVSTDRSTHPPLSKAPIAQQ